MRREEKIKGREEVKRIDEMRIEEKIKRREKRRREE